MDLQISSDTNKRFRLAPLVVVTACVLAYVNAFRGVFILDDFGGIVRNPGIGNFMASIANTSRVLIGISFYLNYKLGGLRAADYHAVNLAIHIAAALCLFGVVRCTLKLPKLADRYRGCETALACVVATVWAVHPLQTESVTYISQRAESLMGLFCFMTMYCFVIGSQSRNGGSWYTASIVACALGMATKPIMVMTPILILLYDRFFLAGTFGNALRSRWSVYLGLATTWFVLLILLSEHIYALKVIGYASSGISISRLDYFLTEQGVILHYLKLVLWPHPLCLDYAWTKAASFKDLLVPGLINMALLVMTLWASLRRNFAGFCGLWFIVLLLPTSSILPLGDCANEHRMYLPLAGIVAAGVIGLYAVLRNRVVPCILLGMSFMTVALLVTMTFYRNKDYYSEEAMWRSVVETRPMNLRAGNEYAVALSEGGKVDEALAEYRRVLSLIPAELLHRLDSGEIRMNGTVFPDSWEYNYSLAHANMGLLLYTLGKNDEAIAQYAAAMRVIPYLDNLESNMRRAIRKRGVAGNSIDAEMAKELLRVRHEGKNAQ